MKVICDFTIDDIPEEELAKLYNHFFKEWEQEHREAAEEKQPASQDPDTQTRDDEQR